jgi:hypothetical protein
LLGESFIALELLTIGWNLFPFMVAYRNLPQSWVFQGLVKQAHLCKHFSVEHLEFPVQGILRHPKAEVIKIWRDVKKITMSVIVVVYFVKLCDKF